MLYGSLWGSSGHLKGSQLHLEKQIEYNKLHPPEKMPKEGKDNKKIKEIIIST